MAKAWHCSPQEVLDAPAPLVLLSVEYEAFLSEYEKVFMEINRNENR